RTVRRAGNLLRAIKIVGLGFGLRAHPELFDDRVRIRSARPQAVRRIDAQAANARRLLNPALRHAFERLLHEVGPDRDGRQTALLVAPKGTALIEADPGRRDDVGAAE